MKVPIFLLCDNAAIGQDNKLSVFGVFDRALVEGFPAIQSKFSVVIQIADLKPGSHKFALYVVSPTGEKNQGKLEQNFETKPGRNFQIIIEVVGLLLDREGDYFFELTIDGELVSQRLKLTVEKVAAMINETVWTTNQTNSLQVKA